MTRISRAGFSLLEMMIALAIMAGAFAAIAGANNASSVGTVRSYRVVVAAELMRGIVLDIEEEYQVDGFPENDREGQDCDVPAPWDRVFTCTYDLVGLDADADVMSELTNNTFTAALGSLDPSTLAQGGGAEALEAAGVNMSGLASLAPLFGPQGAEVLSTCRINLAAIIQSVTGITTFFPEVVRKAAEQTRKLTVRLSYEDTPRTSREIKIETFIVAIPREELERSDQLQKIQDSGVLNNLGGQHPAAPGGNGGHR